MKTQADYDLILQQPAREHSLGIECGDASLLMRQGPAELPPVDLDSVDQVIQAIEVMANGWLLLGTQEKTSKLHDDPGKKNVHEYDINDAIAWPNFVRKMARSARNSGDSEACIVRYLRVREHQTRKAATKYWKDDNFPWGEALRKAQTLDMAVLWTVTAQTNAFGVQVNIPGITDVPERDTQTGKRAARSTRSPSPMRPHIRPRLAESESSHQSGRSSTRGKTTIRPEWRNLASRDLKAHMICPDFNKACCNAPSPGQCPRGLLHRCSVVLNNGSICGANNHSKWDCPRRPENGGAGNKGGKGGKGKGQSKDHSWSRYR